MANVVGNVYNGCSSYTMNEVIEGNVAPRPRKSTYIIVNFAMLLCCLWTERTWEFDLSSRWFMSLRLPCRITRKSLLGPISCDACHVHACQTVVCDRSVATSSGKWHPLTTSCALHVRRLLLTLNVYACLLVRKRNYGWRRYSPPTISIYMHSVRPPAFIVQNRIVCIYSIRHFLAVREYNL